MPVQYNARLKRLFSSPDCSSLYLSSFASNAMSFQNACSSWMASVSKLRSWPSQISTPLYHRGHPVPVNCFVDSVLDAAFQLNSARFVSFGCRELWIPSKRKFLATLRRFQNAWIWKTDQNPGFVSFVTGWSVASGEGFQKWGLQSSIFIWSP